MSIQEMIEMMASTFTNLADDVGPFDGEFIDIEIDWDELELPDE